MFASIGNLLVPVQNIYLVAETAEKFEVHYHGNGAEIKFVDKKAFPDLTIEGIRQHIRDVSKFGN